MLDSLKAMPRYEAYKDSGVEWLGEVPEHWELSKLGTCLKPVSEKNRPDLPLLSITREQGVIQRNVDDQDENHNFIPDDLSNYKVLKQGQFGMNKMKAWQGSYGVSDYTGIVSPAYFIFEFSKEMEPRFFHLAIRSHLYISFFGSASDGVRIGQWDLSKPRMKEIPFVIPRRDEQTAIANYLDRITAQIDQAVAIKEQQIALLKERKQILIQHAVTRGLNPNAPLRDSSVEWIGEIPAHWVVSKLGHFSVVTNGSTPSRDTPKYWNNGTIPWLASGKVNDFEVNSPSEFVTEAALRECSLRLYPVGTVIIGIVGQGKTRGTSAILNIEAAINQNVAGIVPKKELASKFLHRYLVQAYEQIRNYGKGSNQEALNCEVVSSIKIALPPPEEQTAIVTHIETQSAKIDRAIDLQQQQIDRLKEYKATLINSAVTGKIRVPGAAEGKGRAVA